MGTWGLLDSTRWLMDKLHFARAGARQGREAHAPSDADAPAAHVPRGWARWQNGAIDGAAFAMALGAFSEESETREPRV